MTDQTSPIPQQAVTALAQEAYKDILQPSARRVGGVLDDIAKIALSPVYVLNWGYEQSKDWLAKKIQDRLAKTPSEHVVEPSSGIKYQVLMHIAASHDEPELRDLYAELLLKSMDARTANAVHPSYVYAIQQLSPQEVLVLAGLHDRSKAGSIFTEEFSTTGSSYGPSIEKQFLKYCESIGIPRSDKSEIWLHNLRRLELLELRSASDTKYHPESANRYGTYGPSIETSELRELSFTAYGREFIAACSPPADAC